MTLKPHAPAGLPRQLPPRYRDEPSAAWRDLLPKSFPTTSLIATAASTLGFSPATKDTMPYQVRDVEQVIAEFREDGQPYAVFIDNNLGSRPDSRRDAKYWLPFPLGEGWGEGWGEGEIATECRHPRDGSTPSLVHPHKIFHPTKDTQPC